MNKDLILGAYVNYEYDQLQYWINSIKRSGFIGDVVVLVGNTSVSTVEKLIQKGVKILSLGRNEETKRFEYIPTGPYPIHDDRFYWFYSFLNNENRWKDYNRVITVDMKDLIFQINPTEWLDDNLISKLIIGSECLTYENEPWGRQNLIDVKGPLYHNFKDKTILNVGIIAGESEYMKDLMLLGYNRTSLVEQANLNILLQSKPFSDITHYARMHSGFACHLGTTMDPSKIDQFKPYLLEPEPIWDETNSVMKTRHGQLFCAVHQYDRVPHVKQAIETKYHD